MSETSRLYAYLKSLLPGSLRQVLSTLNQRLFARRTLRRKYGAWFEVDWRKNFRGLTDAQWKEAYDTAWANRKNDCVEETDAVRILASLGLPGTVVEVGCGIGSLAMKLAMAGHRVTGVDVSHVALREAEKRARAARLTIAWHEGFAEHLPFKDKSFDYLTCCHTLEHVKDLNRAVAEFLRVARRKVVVLVPKQQFKLYMDNYHTQFFERGEDLTHAFGLPRYECTEIDCSDRAGEFQGKAFLYIGFIE